MNPIIMQEIHAMASVFTHLASADDIITNEEILTIFGGLLKYYGAVANNTDITEIISSSLESPLELHEALDIIKLNPNSALTLMLQSALLIAVDGNIHFFEEALLRAISQDLFSLEADGPLEELIAGIRKSLQQTKEQHTQSDSSGDFDWL